MPNSLIYLCDVPLENDYKNTFTFKNRAAQQSYFNSKIAKTYDNYNYLRKDNTIVVSGGVDELRQYNYLFYQNSNFSNKWFYCFITNHEYISDDSTRLYIETDVIQTWYFEIEYNQTFIEREHVTDDTPGLHTIPENLQLGEYVQYKRTAQDSENYCIVMASTYNPITNENCWGGRYNGIYSSYNYFYYNDYAQLQDDIDSMTSKNKQDAIISLFLAPTWLINGWKNEPHGEVGQSGTPNYKFIDVVKMGVLAGNYEPRNKKLLTFPYCYLLATNNNGATALYHQELFAELGKCTLRIRGCLTPGCSTMCIPFNYKTASNDENLSEGIVGGKFPQLNWNTDQYINWLTQNGVNYATSSISQAITGGTSLASGDFASSANTLLNVINSARQTYLAQVEPPQIHGNVNAGDIVTGLQRNEFDFYQMSIRPEYSKIIDEFFDMFGYKVNRVKSPQIHTRQNWNYLKTISCNFSGNIPQNDMLKIKGIFDNGITFWHNPNNIFNYSLPNGII